MLIEISIILELLIISLSIIKPFMEQPYILTMWIRLMSRITHSKIIKHIFWLILFSIKDLIRIESKYRIMNLNIH